MPNISSKAVTMPESPIRKLVPYAEKAKSSGKSVFHLNIGQPDIETPEAALKAIKNIDQLDFNLTESVYQTIIRM
jgi:aspartate aminotransferase